ncbi:hypothetical protein C2U68_14045 [Methylomonas koyamae]|nr:hypothetical protein C2U68_14045 [Methylomonas koyamae]
MPPGLTLSAGPNRPASKLDATHANRSAVQRDITPANTVQPRLDQRCRQISTRQSPEKTLHNLKILSILFHALQAIFKAFYTKKLVIQA